MDFRRTTPTMDDGWEWVRAMPRPRRFQPGLTGSRPGSHSSPRAELARRARAWSRIHPFLACRRPQSAAGHYLRGSICALKGKRQARTRPAPHVSANRQNGTNKLLKKRSLQAVPASRREVRANRRPGPERALWLERSGRLWNGLSTPEWQGWLPPGACPCLLPKRCRPGF